MNKDNLSRITSASGDNGVEQILDADVVVHYLRLDAVNLALLLLELLLQFSKLVLQRSYNLLCDSLLLLQLGNTRQTLLLPMLVLLIHAVNIVSYKINRLS